MCKVPFHDSILDLGESNLTNKSNQLNKCFGDGTFTNLVSFLVKDIPCEHKDTFWNDVLHIETHFSVFIFNYTFSFFANSKNRLNVECVNV